MEVWHMEFNAAYDRGNFFPLLLLAWNQGRNLANFNPVLEVVHFIALLNIPCE
jgi:hypothetical protein